MEHAVVELEKVCVYMYETQDSNVREEAQKVLLSFVEDPEVLQKCQLLLQRASSPYSLMIAASTLIKKVTPTRQSTPLSVQERLDIRNYVLNYLFTGPKQQPFVKDELMQLYSRITKVSWFETKNEKWCFREVISEISQFLQGGIEKCQCGVELFTKLVVDMNSLSNMKPMVRHWKIASSFKDHCLYEIFVISCNYLQNGLQLPPDQMQGERKKLMGSLLKLSQSCLCFDFIGTSVDESSDDLGTVQIPNEWKKEFINMENNVLKTPKLFFELYDKLPSELSAVVISCLVQIISVRRSMFNSVERKTFLCTMVDGIYHMFDNHQKLGDEDTFHEFCRMLARLKANYQLGELVKLGDSYRKCISLIAKFSITSIKCLNFSKNSIHYLLCLWQRMASSVPYIKAQEPHGLENYMPEVMKAFIEARISEASNVEADVFDDRDFVEQQLEQVATIGRCEYKSTCQLLVLLYDENTSLLEQLMNKQDSNQQLQIAFNKLTWVVYLIGSMIGGRVSFAATDEHDEMDGELIVRVIRLMNVVNECLSGGKGVKSLDLAIIYFFEQFRKIYVGEQVKKTSKVFIRLNEVLNIKDDGAMLDVIINKIVTNLKYWTSDGIVLSKTLNLFNELTVGFSCVRKLKKVQTVQLLMGSDHTNAFPFLDPVTSVVDSRFRTVFYQSIGRILMVDLGEDKEKLHKFMKPLVEKINSIKQMMMSLSNDNNAQLNEHTMKVVIAVCRDFRGVIFSFNTKVSFSMFFDIIYPVFFDLLQKSLQLWGSIPQLSISVLKLLTEMVMNRGQRLMFEITSPNGILLFKEASKAVCIYGTCLLSRQEPLPKDKVYSHRLKGMTQVFRLLKNALCGNFVNFGVFTLYNDQCLDEVLQVSINLMTTLPSASFIMEYKKLSSAYYSLIEVITQDHIKFISALSSDVLYHVLSTVVEGVTCIDSGISSSCCISLDNVVSHLYRTHSLTTQHNMAGDHDNHLEQLIAENRRLVDEHRVERERHFINNMLQKPQLLQTGLSSILQTIMFDDFRNMWSLSRPLLPLILVNPQYFESFQKSICKPTSHHGALNYRLISDCFDQLMLDIDKNLHLKNRDKFTQNMTTFRREISNILKTDPTKPTEDGSLNLVTSNSMMS